MSARIGTLAKLRSGARAIAFGCVGEPLGAVLTENARLHLAGRITPDTWRGGEAAQLEVVDASEPP